MARREVTCGVCLGQGFIRNPKTGVYNVLCPNCKGKGSIIIESR